MSVFDLLPPTDLQLTGTEPLSDLSTVAQPELNLGVRPRDPLRLQPVFLPLQTELMGHKEGDLQICRDQGNA